MKKWNMEEISYLSKNYTKFGTSKCAEVLKRSRSAVSTQARKMKLPAKGRKWTEKDTSILIDRYAELGSIKLGILLDRTPGAIRRLASELKIQGNTQKAYSTKAIEWLESFEYDNILHAENEGEQYIAGYNVDGYSLETNTIYEFHGNVFHGNPRIYKPLDTPNPFDRRKTAQELFDKTIKRMEHLSTKANIIFIWEDEYDNDKPFSFIKRRP